MMSDNSAQRWPPHCRNCTTARSEMANSDYDSEVRKQSGRCYIKERTEDTKMMQGKRPWIYLF